MANTSTPLSFPVPADLTGFWTFDQIHGPRPLTPLSEEVVLGALTEGFCSALRDVGYPFGWYFRAVNHYAYQAFLPHDVPLGENGTETFRYHGAVSALMSSLGQRWAQEWLPSILVGLDRLRTLDYSGLSDEALLAAFSELRRDYVERWRIHGYLLFAYQAASVFDDFYQAAFHPDDPSEPYQLLNGFGTRSFEANRELWRLSRVIRQSSALSPLFQGLDATRIAADLRNTEEGRCFLAQLKQYLKEYGWRSDAVYELAEPAWREDLHIPVKALQGLIGLDDTQDPDSQLRQVAARRDGLLRQARAQLADDAERRARFEELYAQARDQVKIDEDHNFYIDQMGSVGLRLPILELGRRLVQRGSIDEIADVFMLTTGAIEAGLAGVDQRAVVVSRRIEHAYWMTVLPPSSLGDLPAEEDVDPFMEAVIKLDAPPTPREQLATVIRGTPASPGTIRGRAKVALSLEEASGIERGQILICEMTLPPWSVLFPTIGAVVADTGGVLSHCATVAREYGVPGVVGTIVGTKAIPDGALVEVDGSRGEIRILAVPP